MLMRFISSSSPALIASSLSTVPCEQESRMSKRQRRTHAAHAAQRTLTVSTSIVACRNEALNVATTCFQAEQQEKVEAMTAGSGPSL